LQKKAAESSVLTLRTAFRYYIRLTHNNEKITLPETKAVPDRENFLNYRNQNFIGYKFPSLAKLKTSFPGIR